MANISVVLGGVGLCFYSLTFLACITMIVLISIRIRPLKSNVPMLLIYNTYFNLFIFATIMLVMYIYNEHGNLNPSIWLGGRWCQIRTYFVHVCLCTLYYSFILQAIFRLFRIVFYKYKTLQSFSIFISGIIIQWILSFLFLLPNLLLDDFQYLPFEYNCWIAFENIRGLIMVIIIIYGTSTFSISFMYMYIIRYIHQSNNIHQRRQNSSKRDLTILKRLVILVTVVAGLGFPTVIVIFIYVCTNYIIPFAYHIQGVSLSIGAFTASISLIFITPQIQELLKRSPNQVQPIATIAFTIDRPCKVQDILQQ
ncbi:unnamed protein product [Rotaria sp. Silwood2]|nr:unnamed protein product [Rotaria sp. Silwood2]CAF2659153.1 unnamed protein product [Rotaria sp. Silwood2]CAF4279415.1 unnamed protein product [Rotaria sp. Silwood2]